MPFFQFETILMNGNIIYSLLETCFVKFQEITMIAVELYIHIYVVCETGSVILQTHHIYMYCLCDQSRYSPDTHTHTHIYILFVRPVPLLFTHTHTHTHTYIYIYCFKTSAWYQERFKIIKTN